MAPIQSRVPVQSIRLLWFNRITAVDHVGTDVRELGHLHRMSQSRFSICVEHTHESIELDD